MKSLFRSFLGVFIGLFISSIVGAGPVHADFEVPPPPPGNLWTASVDVPDHCTAIDTDGVSHTYNSAQYLGICALQAAINGGLVSGVQLSNAFPSLGLFVTAIQGVATDPNSQYWALYQNGAFANFGLVQLQIAAGDTLVLELHDFSDNFLDSRLTITINSQIASAPTPNIGRGGGLTLHDPFDVPRALAYLTGAQHADGSFDSFLLSDWAAIAFAGGGAGDAQKKLAQYFTSNPPELQSVSDYERHAMALLALGINPYGTSTLAGTTSNPISLIVNAFDGTQVGDASLVNDDVFALFPLLHSGYSTNDDVIKKTSAFIISKQLANGSWESSVDMTAAAVQALALVRQIPEASSAINSAMNYIHSQQQNDGSFKNSFSTSWVLQAISALSDSLSNWSAGYFSPQYYLATLQQTDGGVEPAGASMNTRVWATAYAIPGISGKTWDSLLSSFGRPVVLQTAPVQIATATPSVATGTVTAADTAPVVMQEAVAETKPPVEPEGVPEEAIPEDTPVVPPESASPPEEAPQSGADKASPAETPETTQVAAVATVSSDPVEWALALILLLLIALLALLMSRNRLHKRRQSEK